MNKAHLHKHLKRQIDKFFSEDFIDDNPALESFIQTVNQTYLNYDKDAELSEQSASLNDKEYAEINAKLKDELDKKEFFQRKLIDAIKELDYEIDTRAKAPKPQAECDLTLARWFKPDASA